MDAIDHVLSRGVDSIYPSKKAFEQVLRSGKKLTLYQGFDPTGTDLHIGHAVAIRKLREFQDLGHHVIFLIGDGTGQAGDPSGKMKARGRFMSKEELRENARDYVKQAGKIVRFEGENPVEIKYNSDWLNTLRLVDILDIAQHFSVQQLIERDMFQERLKAKETINLREFLYPLLQGYDSVAMNVDLELGGTDQTFNMLTGRTLVQAMQQREKFVMTVPLLTDSKGIKIGKTEGNAIGLTDKPSDFYGKIMSLGDDAIIPCFTLLTDMEETEVADMKRRMEHGDNPMQFKKQLAYMLTAWLNSPTEARDAQDSFEQTFQKKAGPAPDLITEVAVSSDTIDLIETLLSSGLVQSKSEGRRLIEQKAVSVQDVPINQTHMSIEHDTMLKIGKKRFLRIVRK